MPTRLGRIKRSNKGVTNIEKCMIITLMGERLNNRQPTPWRVVLAVALLTATAACAPTTGQTPLEPVAPDAQTAVPDLPQTPSTPELTLAESLASIEHAEQAAEPELDRFGFMTAEVTVREGLEAITQRYIDPVNIDALAMGGLWGLATIDPTIGLHIDDTNHQLHIRRGEQTLTTLPAPADKTAEAWAKLTADVLRAGRAHSPDLKKADDERVYEAMFDGMLSNLDAFSRYAGAEEARANRARRDGFGGIGIRFTGAEKGVLVTHVMGDSPAKQGGLRPGDVITKVDGHPTPDMKLRDVAKMLRGPVGSLITVSVRRLNAKEGWPDRKIDYNLQRAHIVPETVRTDVRDDLLVLRVTSFNKNTSSSMLDALRANDQAMRDGDIKGIVMDLRGNPGGLLSQSVNVADLFLNKGRIIATRGRHPDSFHEYTAGGVDLARGLPLAILVDGDSASAAEIVASALQDLGRAVVIGSASYGKGTVQTVLRLPNDGEVTLTWSRFVSPSGYAIHGLGVIPSVCVTDMQPPTELDTETLTEKILDPEHIDANRGNMDAWRAAGVIFDGRRGRLRASCPARSFKADEQGDLLMDLARRVIHNPSVYRRAVMLSQPLSTASR